VSQVIRSLPLPVPYLCGDCRLFLSWPHASLHKLNSTLPPNFLHKLKLASFE
jgi:hypothetical protein